MSESFLQPSYALTAFHAPLDSTSPDAPEPVSVLIAEVSSPSHRDIKSCRI
jgi:hypothetical protein